MLHLSNKPSLEFANTGGTVTQHRCHAEFKQLASQSKGDIGLFEVTLHRTVARTEAEEVEIGETEKGNCQFSECPLCAGPVSHLMYLLNSERPTCHERRFAVLKSRTRSANVLKKELESKTIGNLQLTRGYVMEEGAIFKISGEGGKEVTRPLAPRPLRVFIIARTQQQELSGTRGRAPFGVGGLCSDRLNTPQAAVGACLGSGRAKFGVYPVRPRGLGW